MIDRVSCKFVEKNFLMCPHEVYWTINYAIKWHVKGVVQFKNGDDPAEDEERDGWAGPYPEMYLVLKDGYLPRLDWKNKPSYRCLGKKSFWTGRNRCESCRCWLEAIEDYIKTDRYMAYDCRKTFIRLKKEKEERDGKVD